MLSYSELAARVGACYGEAPTIQTADDIRLVLDRSADELLVLVPGTTDVQGWLDDFSGWPRHFDELGSYHEGFGSHGIALFRALEPKLPAPPTHGYVTTYAGHSLGAALALTLAILHGRSGFGPCRLVTFGCPRAAALWNVIASVQMYKARDLKRFVRIGDPIPTVPAAPFYKHLSGPFFCGEAVLSGKAMINHSIALYASDLKDWPTAQV